MFDDFSPGKFSLIGQISKDIGLPVSNYSPPPILWQRPIWLILTLPVLYLTVLNQLRRVLHLPTTDPRRKNTGWCMILFIVGFVSPSRQIAQKA